MDRLADSLRSTAEHAKRLHNEHPTATTFAAAAVALSSAYVAWRYLKLNTTTTSKTSTGLSLGKEKDGASRWATYQSSWTNGNEQANGGTGNGHMPDVSQAPSVVNDFYSFVTDIYEWGWGTSFHFAPKLWGHDWRAGEAAQEVRIAHLLCARPGARILDVGCGVGGPMRTIAASTGAHITGITISEYQVERARALNDRAGMRHLTEVVQGDFHKMPFEDASFDAVFAVEATCHASTLESVYGEICRVLKPGGRFVSQEWVSTPKFDAANAEHCRIIDEINFGNSLPNMRTWKQAEAAGGVAGFELVNAYDAAEILIGPNRPWYERLTQYRHLHHVDDIIIKVLGTLRVIPHTLIDVHTMLVRVAYSLIEGGQSGVFTPMYMLCFEKPAGKKK